MADNDIRDQDNYLKKLNTLLPSEVTGLYLFIRTSAQNDRSLDIWLAIFAVIVAIVFYFIAPRLLKIDQRLSRILYSVTFILWAASIDIWVIVFRTGWPPIAFVLTASIAIWTFALPYVFDSLKEKTV